MRTKNFKRWVAGLCAATMLAGVPAMVGYAVQPELTETNQGGETSVKAEVVESAPVNYVVAIPEQVNFGRLQKPNSEGSRYVTQPITVECTVLDGLEKDEMLAVLVKDSEARMREDNFKLKNENGKELVYEIINNKDESIKETQPWYSDGFWFGSFAEANQSIESTLRLDRGQLYGQDLALWGGNYTGALSFTAKIVRTDVNGNIAD